ncbi:hypothetical protein ACWD33_26110 [Streptomyces xiamenensis]
MPGPWPFGEPIEIVRPGAVTGRDEYGKPVTGPPEVVEIRGCVVVPRQEPPHIGGAEQQGRDTVIVGWTVYAPTGTDIRTTDQARIRGVLCEVTGEPGNWGRSPFTGTAGPVQFAADRVTG